MRKSVIAAVVVVALVGAAVAAVPVVERLAAAQLKSGIEGDGLTKVGSVEIGLFDRRITVLDLKSAGDSEVSVGRWQALGLAWPLGELLRGRTPIAGFRWGDPLRAERMELQDFRLVDRASGSRWSMDWLGIDGLDLERFDAAAEGQNAFQALVARALAALTMGRLDQRNVIFAVPGTGDTFGVASVVVEGYQRGRIAAMTIAGLEATASDGEAPLYRIADVKAGGIDFGRIIAAMSSDTWLPGDPVGRVHVDKASAEGFGGETLKRYGISLRGARFETIRENDKTIRTRTSIEGFVLAPPLRGLEGLSMRLTLQSMGLRDVKADFGCAATENHDKGELVVDRCALTGPGLGEIDFTARIVQADATFWRALDDGDTRLIYDSTAALGSARLVVADKSLLERGLKALSTVTGQPASVTRANLARDIRRYQPTGVLISQSMTQLLDTVARFVEQGGTLTFDAQPEHPVGFDRFEYLTSPGADLVSVLGLKAALSR